MMKRIVLSAALFVGASTAASAKHHRHHRPHHRHASMDGAHAVSTPLLKVASRNLGGGNFTGFRGPWCAAAVGKWLHAAGYSRLSSLRAVDYRHYGRATSAHVGAIAVMPHHVGIVAGFARGGVLLLSGNHSHRVGMSLYAMRRFIAFREPI